MNIECPLKYIQIIFFTLFIKIISSIYFNGHSTFTSATSVMVLSLLIEMVQNTYVKEGGIVVK